MQATVHRQMRVSASLFSFWRSLQGRAVPAAQAAEREGGSEPGLVQGTPGVEVREQISRLGVGGGAQILGPQDKPEGEGKGGLGEGRIRTRWEGAAAFAEQ